jgi:hypothetical protein
MEWNDAVYCHITTRIAAKFADELTLLGTLVGPAKVTSSVRMNPKGLSRVPRCTD